MKFIFYLLRSGKVFVLEDTKGLRSLTFWSQKSKQKRLPVVKGGATLQF